MHQIRGQGMWHDTKLWRPLPRVGDNGHRGLCRPRGTRFAACYSHPPLKRWAIIFRLAGRDSCFANRRVRGAGCGCPILSPGVGERVGANLCCPLGTPAFSTRPPLRSSSSSSVTLTGEPRHRRLASLSVTLLARGLVSLLDATPLSWHRDDGSSTAGDGSRGPSENRSSSHN